ncbi:hypothetical protein KY290_000146 [Solanum tuberosum]|uniref:Pentatricopeptide repeat-containing protein n=1 Tax=Solanum tuberosum TaxID=4113 RepID=A0ABQ7WIH2_SOLTU|nr:hypothetical protein KY290_000146 [Solanum tuberosum]
MMVHADVKCGLMKPNEANFVSIFSSYTFLDVCVALYLGRQVHAYMVKNEDLSVFMTTTLIAFYGNMGCLIYASKMFDLSGRAGLLQEVYDFLKKMPFEADGAIELENEVAQLFVDFMELLNWKMK